MKHFRSNVHSSPGFEGPRFVVFEGIDGSGKSLQAKMLADCLVDDGLRVLLTAEPSDGPIGLKIRSMAVRPGAEEEERLFLEDRRDHVTRVIAPALKNGRIVICDRYIHSSVAYQGARGLDPQRILDRNLRYVVPPDLVFLLEIPIDEALARISAARPEGMSLYEERESLKAVDGIYRSLDDPSIVRINGADSPERVHAQIVMLFRSRT